MTNSSQPQRLYWMVQMEIKKVPLGWTHPKGTDGRYVLLYDEAYEPGDQVMPDVSKLAPQEIGIAVYETVSVPSLPISPVFPETDDGRNALVQYCAEHDMGFGMGNIDSPEAWFGILF